MYILAVGLLSSIFICMRSLSLGALYVIFIGLIVYNIRGLAKNGMYFLKVYLTVIIAELTVIPSILEYILLETDLSDKYGMNFLGFELFLAVIFFINVILLIRGIIFYSKNKKNVKLEKEKKYKNSILMYIIIFIEIWAMIFGCVIIPRLFKSPIEKKAEEYTLNYLNDKYGNKDFKVIKINRDYHSYTFGETPTWVGFEFEVKSSYFPKTIIVNIKGTTEDSLKVECDSFKK